MIRARTTLAALIYGEACRELGTAQAIRLGIATKVADSAPAAVQVDATIRKLEVRREEARRAVSSEVEDLPNEMAVALIVGLTMAGGRS